LKENYVNRYYHGISTVWSWANKGCWRTEKQNGRGGRNIKIDWYGCKAFQNWI